ncbi:MAG: TenA family protein, partial [Thermoleophilia bacterium]
LFLEDFGRALALCAARAPRAGDLRLLCGHAGDALDVERELHEHLTHRLGIGAAEVRATRPGPTTLAYGSFLVRAAATGAPAEALAALAPCYLMFRRVGTALAGAGSPDPEYAAWIATYDGDAFGAATDSYAEVCERALAGLAGDARDAALDAARAAARYEWMFWEAAWTGEEWPGPGVTRCSPSRTSG